MKLLKHILVGALLVPALSASAHAADKLTEEMIREHYEQSVKMVEINDIELLMAYFDKFLADDGLVKYNFPVILSDGSFGESVTYVLTKEQLLSRFRHGPSWLWDVKMNLVEYRVESVQVQDGGETAVVHDYSLVSIPYAVGLVHREVFRCKDDVFLADEGHVMFQTIDCTLKASEMVTEEEARENPEPEEVTQSPEAL